MTDRLRHLVRGVRQPAGESLRLAPQLKCCKAEATDEDEKHEGYADRTWHMPPFEASDRARAHS